MMVVSAVSWVAWSAVLMTEDDRILGNLHPVVESLLRAAVIVLTIVASVSVAVAPLVRNTKVWYELGKLEQKRQCTCHHSDGNIVYIDRVNPQQRNRLN